MEVYIVAAKGRAKMLGVYFHIRAVSIMEVLGWNVPLWLLMLLFIVITYIIYMTWHFGEFKRMGVRGPKPIPILGTILHIHRHGFMNIDKLWMKEYGKVYGTFDGRVPNLIVADEDMLREIFVKQFSNFTDRQIPEGFNGDLQDALSSVSGNHWKHLRHLISPTFSSGKLKKMIPTIKKSSDSLMDYMLEQSKIDPQLDVKRCFGGYTMDIIASSAFGIDVNSNKNPNDPFVQNASRLLDISLSSPKFVFMIFFPFLLKPVAQIFGINLLPNDVQKFFRKVVVSEINKRTTDKADYVDFLQMMIQAHNDEEVPTKSEEKKGMTFSEILGNCLIFFFAGYETTASTLSFLTYCMAKNPEIQERLFKEVESCLGDEMPNYENINKLTYLEMCINETLRMFPPVTRTDRKCTQDTEVKGLKIAKNVIVSVPIYALHHSPELWEDPERFDPDRFSPENKAKHSTFQFLPFGYGPRNCIGMRLALIEIKMAFARCIRNFRFAVGDRTELSDTMGDGGLLFPKQLWIKVHPRT